MKWFRPDKPAPAQVAVEPDLQPAPVAAPVIVVPESVAVSQSVTVAPIAPQQAVSLAEAFAKVGIQARHVEFARQRSMRTREPLTVVLRDLGVATGEQIARALASAHRLEYVDPRRVDDLNFTELRFDLVRQRARENMVPIASDRHRVVVAVADETVLAGTAVDLRTHWAPYEVVPAIASRETLATLWRRLYADTHEAVLTAESAEVDGPTYTRDLLEALLRHACFTGCSDLHFTPTEAAGMVRLRRDGLLQPYLSATRAVYERLVGLIANEGAAKEVTTTREAAYPPPPDLAARYGFRVQLTQTVRGMACVIRVLDRQSAVVAFDSLGFDAAATATIQGWAHGSEGLILVTGPTGSGKTTSLFALMRETDGLTHAIHTVENPVELRCSMWHQSQIPSQTGVSEADAFRTFAKGFLRNDIDQGLVGELRDLDTVRAAIDLANTGHLVYGTVHANDAPRTVQRLNELGVSMHSLSAVLTGVLAQRLVPRLCLHCKSPETDPAVHEALIGHPQATPFRSVGCPSCDYTGFRGRIMVYELLHVDAAMRDAIAAGTSHVELARRIPASERMWARGFRHVIGGDTTLAVLRSHVGGEAG